MIIRDMDVQQVVQAIARAMAGAPAPLRCVSDHRRVQQGDICFAIPGQRFDPRTCLAEIAARQPGAIIAAAEGFTPDMAAAAHNCSCAIYLLSNLSAHAGQMAADLLFQDAPLPRLVAVTGTNGKTSVTRWIAQAMSHLDERCAVVGTLGAGFVDEALEYTGLTTPDAVSLHNAIASVSREGARAVALEASSIGLDQGRLSGCRFSVAAFTNLSRDHLDYHGSMQSYEQAKQKLFAWPTLNRAVINMDDPAAERFCAVAERAGVPVIRVTASEKGIKAYAGTQTLAVAGTCTGDGSSIQLRWQNEQCDVQVPVVGQFNLENIAVVAGVLLACGYDLPSVAQALAVLTPPPGRMQMIAAHGKPLVVVDYAHTPDALEKVLTALRPVSQARSGKLLALFGCGGDRDPGKRPLMGAVAQRLADVVFVTSDNPRSESPATIIQAIVAGMPQGAVPVIIEDRAQAIAKAIAQSDVRDVVLLAGKGHETGQIVGDSVLPFSDIEQTLKVFDALVTGGQA